MGNTYTGSDVGKGGLEVTEVDGAPDARGVNKITVSNGTLTDDGGGEVTITTGGGGGGGNTLDQAYDQGGGGAGRTIDADSGAVTITVSDTDNNPVLQLTQNDVTNNPQTLIITNTGTGDTLNVTNSIGEAFTVNNAEVVVNEAGADIDFRVETVGGTSALLIEGAPNTATFNVVVIPNNGINTIAVGGISQWTPFDMGLVGPPVQDFVGIASPTGVGLAVAGWIPVTGTNSFGGPVYIPVWG